MRGLAVLVAIGAALVGTGASTGSSLLPSQKQALHAVSRAVKSGRIDAPTAASARTEIARAARLIRGLPAGRGWHVAVALSELAAFDGRMTEPRMLALVGQLKANNDYFALHWAPADKTDITDTEGIVYRYFSGRCFELHPLADFGALNARIAAGDAAGTEALADALIARGVFQHGGGVGWEYYFDFSGGRAPWLSGMAQAVAAQAFARAATLVPQRSTAYLRAAHNAYDLIPRKLLTDVAAGPWIRLYAFQSLAVLNAQLQTVVSLRDYATATEDTAAATLATRMQNAAAATLPRFDTGYWTYYSLARDPSPLDYQQYVVQLLAKLSPSDPRFAAARTRIAAYATQPPAFMVANATALGALRLWVSKPSTVQIDSATGPTRRISLAGGWTTIAGKEPTRPGVYPVRVTATDWAGNHASFEALPVIRVATAATQKTAARKSADAGAPSAAPPVIGAALDDPAQGGLAQKLGLRVVRLGVAWPVGAVVPDPGLIAALQKLPARIGVVVELGASPLPSDSAGQTALAQYAASLAQQEPQLRDLLLTPAPTTQTSPAYAAVLLAVRDAVQAVTTSVAVGPLIDGAVSPKATLTALGRAFAASGRAAPFVDVVALRPAATPASTGQWTEANVPQLAAAAAAVLGGSAPPAAHRRARDAHDRAGNRARRVRRRPSADQRCGLPDGPGSVLRDDDHQRCVFTERGGSDPRPSARQRVDAGSTDRRRLREREPEAVGRDRHCGGTPGAKGHSRLPGPRLDRDGEYVHLPADRVQLGRDDVPARLHTGLPVRRHARRRGRQAPRCRARGARRRGSAGERHAPEGEARHRPVHDRPTPGGAGQSRNRDATDERAAQRRLEARESSPPAGSQDSRACSRARSTAGRRQA